MTQQNDDQNDDLNSREPRVNRSDQRQPHPGGLANQNLTRPAPIDQPAKNTDQSEHAQPQGPGAT
jgi:hypothetical protein